MSKNFKKLPSEQKTLLCPLDNSFFGECQIEHVAISYAYLYEYFKGFKADSSHYLVCCNWTVTKSKVCALKKKIEN